ncbi:MAG: hypothetical protein OXI73_01840 [Rhodospirillales bacterium]|nr:hypothetical protein [Rhodospirillales bacterium]
MGTTFVYWIGNLLLPDPEPPAPAGDPAGPPRTESAAEPGTEAGGEESGGSRSYYREVLEKLKESLPLLEAVGVRITEALFGDTIGGDADDSAGGNGTDPDDDQAVSPPVDGQPDPEDAGIAQLGQPPETPGPVLPDDAPDDDVKSRAAPAIAEARGQVQAVSARLAVLEQRLGELQRDDVAAPELSAGYDKVTSALRDFKRQAEAADAGWRQLDAEVVAASQQDLRRSSEWESKLELLTQSTKILHDAVVVEKELEVSIEELHWDSAQEILRVAEQALKQERADEQTAFDALKEKHKEFKAKEDEALQKLEGEVAAAQEELKRLSAELAAAQADLAELEVELRERQAETAVQEAELETAQIAVKDRKAALKIAEAAVTETSNQLAAARAKAETLARRLDRILALDREFAVSSDGYRAQLAHYLAADARHVHVIDGGAADNLGFTLLLELLASWQATGDGSAQTALSDEEGTLSHVGIVAVDARSAPVRDYEANATSPDILDTVVATVSAAIDSKSFLLARELGNVTRRLQDDGVVLNRHIVNVGFDDITDFHMHAGPPAVAHVHAVKEDSEHARTDHGDDEHSRQVETVSGTVDLQACKRAFQQIPTTWHIPGTTVAALMAMGEALVRDSRAYRSLVGEFGGALPAGGRSVAEVCACHVDRLLPRDSGIPAEVKPECANG